MACFRGFPGEIEAQFPAYPNDADLLPFEVSKSTNNKFYVDAKSISIGADGVVRYTVVMRMAGGATNVNFEGVRCGTAEYRIYAVGQSSGAWTKARENQWRPIPRTGPNAYDKILYTDFFCPGLLIVDTPEETIKGFKRGAHPRAQ